MRTNLAMLGSPSIADGSRLTSSSSATISSGEGGEVEVESWF